MVLRVFITTNQTNLTDFAEIDHSVIKNSKFQCDRDDEFNLTTYEC